MNTPYRTGDIVRLKSDGGPFGGIPVIIRAVVPRMDLLGSIYIVHPPKEPNNKREIHHHRIAELVEANPLPPVTERTVILRVPPRDATVKEPQPMTETPTHIPPLTLSDDLDPIAKAEAIQSWMETYDRSYTQAAISMSVSRATIDNYMFLLKATGDLRERIRTRQITMYKAIAEMRAAPKIAPEKMTPPAENPSPPAAPADMVPRSALDEAHTHIIQRATEAEALRREIATLQETLASRDAVYNNVVEDYTDLLNQRNAAEETIRKYAAQADLDRDTIETWERTGRDMNARWGQETADYEARIRALETQLAEARATAPKSIIPFAPGAALPVPPRLVINVNVNEGGTLHLVGGGE